MNMYRPYKAIYDYVNNDTNRMHSSMVTLNLFDVRTWIEVDNECRKFNDNIKRTEVICEPNNSFYLRTPYKEFDVMMGKVLEDYRLLDTRSLVNFDFGVNINSSN